MRDSQQWNWETHDVVDINLNNIKGLSPYNHGWIDGLNLSSGKEHHSQWLHYFRK